MKLLDPLLDSLVLEAALRRSQEISTPPVRARVGVTLLGLGSHGQGLGLGHMVRGSFRVKHRVTCSIISAVKLRFGSAPSFIYDRYF